MELDTSFRVSSPYVYCRMNSLHKNESVTIAIAIGMIESADLYKKIYCCLEKTEYQKQFSS